MMRGLPMIYRLIILNGARRGERVTLDPEPMVIGRAQGSAIQFNDPEIALSHAEIFHHAGGLSIRDLGSMNRLLINNREVHEAQLKHGDVVEVGHTRFLVQAYVQAEIQNGSSDEERPPARIGRILGLVGLLMLAALIIFGITRCNQRISGRSRIVTPPAATLRPVFARPAPRLPPLPSEPAETPAPPRASAPPPATTTQAVPSVTLPLPKVDVAPASTTVTEAAPPPVGHDSPAPSREEPRPTASNDLMAKAQLELEEAAAVLTRPPPTNLPPATLPQPPSAPPAAATPAPTAPPVTVSPVMEKPVAPPPPPRTPTPDPMLTIAERAGTLERQGKRDPALLLWRDINLRAVDPDLIARARSRMEALTLAERTATPPFAGHVRILDTDISKFPESSQFHEMRMLNIRLAATEMRKELDPESVRVDVLFYERNPANGQLVPAIARSPAGPLVIQGPWRSLEQKTIAASYVVPVSGVPRDQQPRYAGFAVRVYYYGALQDESLQPRDIPRVTATRAPGN